jgi:hypothetical protein
MEISATPSTIASHTVSDSIQMISHNGRCEALQKSSTNVSAIANANTTMATMNCWTECHSNLLIFGVNILTIALAVFYIASPPGVIIKLARISTVRPQTAIDFYHVRVVT